MASWAEIRLVEMLRLKFPNARFLLAIEELKLLLCQVYATATRSGAADAAAGTRISATVGTLKSIIVQGDLGDVLLNVAV